jgi:hypothetical protein
MKDSKVSYDEDKKMWGFYCLYPTVENTLTSSKIYFEKKASAEFFLKSINKATEEIHALKVKDEYECGSNMFQLEPIKEGEAHEV